MMTGLILGKFAPLHQGHQLLIDRALAEMDHVVVIIYDAPETINVPLSVRSRWIRTLYPSVEVLEAWDGPSAVGSSPEIMKMQEDYILRILGDRVITHFYSSEFYGDHVSKSLNAIDRRVDEARSLVPISASMIRANPFHYRKFLAPEVYRDLIIRVVFLGAPSTGKTTLAETLAKDMNTAWVPEYGREYWERHQQDRRLSPPQLVEIAEGHIEREEEMILDASRLLFVDTDATTTYMFGVYYHGRTEPRLAELADAAIQRYDLFFLCDDDIPYEDTWDRSGHQSRTIYQKQIRSDLIRRKIPFITLKGEIDERVAQVKEILEGFDKYDSVCNQLKK